VPPRKRRGRGEQGFDIDIDRVRLGAKAAPEVWHVMVEDAELELLHDAAGKRGHGSAAQ